VLLVLLLVTWLDDGTYTSSLSYKSNGIACEMLFSLQEWRWMGESSTTAEAYDHCFAKRAV
jgi:hypothetical protein